MTFNIAKEISQAITSVERKINSEVQHDVEIRNSYEEMAQAKDKKKATGGTGTTGSTGASGATGSEVRNRCHCLPCYRSNSTRNNQDGPVAAVLPSWFNFGGAATAMDSLEEGITALEAELKRVDSLNERREVENNNMKQSLHGQREV